MENLVDVFYYDYVLTKIIELYQRNSLPNCIIPYLRVATPLSKKFRDEKVKMDREIYLKEIYIKVVQILKMFDANFISNPNNDEKGAIRRTLECIDLILKDSPALEDDGDFNTIRRVGYSLFLKKGKDASLQSEKFVEKIEQFKASELEKINVMALSFTYNNFMDCLYSISFKNPVMKKFVKYIKDGIDSQQSKKSIVNRQDPGDKMEWL